MVQTVETADKRYPAQLKEALLKLQPSSGPKLLFYKGNWSEDIFNNCLAVVGSRRLTSYGRKAIEQIVGEVAAAGVTIVSGFMYGGDEAAHSAAVKVGGRTIAVMPCGLDIIFPPQHKELHKKILDNNGLVISEYPEGFKPVNYSFVQRDRIVAGLSKAVFVVEASLNSGSLITASYAEKFGRKIFALPGQITSEVSKGTLKLIKEGAEPVTEAADILNFFGISKPGQQQILTPAFAKATDGLERKILEQLSREPMKADDLARTFEIAVSKIGTTLSLMQLKGFINLSGEKYYLN